MNRNVIRATAASDHGTTLTEIAAQLFLFGGQKSYGETINCFLLLDGDTGIMIDPPQFTDTLCSQILDKCSELKLYLTHAATSKNAADWQSVEACSVYLHEQDLST